jgi:hypothetical protein
MGRLERRRRLPTAALAAALALGAGGASADPAAPGHPALDPPRIEGAPAGTPRAERRTARAPTTEWVLHRSADALHPDGGEQEMMWLMNRARQDPAAEGAWLATTSEPDISFPRAYFDVDTDLLQLEFAALVPSPPAAFDRRLYEASLAHSLDLIARNAQDHNGQLGRVDDAGFDYTSGRLSVFSYADSALNAHAALNIDWGPGDGTGMQPGRGHRAAIMEGYDNVGLALVADPLPGVGPWVFSGAYFFADTGSVDHYHRFLVGTVWRDLDGNGRYGDGEGLAGVTVAPDTGAFYAVTAPGGGYAIPITAAGAYQVTFSSGAIGSHQRSVNLGSDSELLDLELPLAVPEPGQGVMLLVGAWVLGGVCRRMQGNTATG